MSVVKAHTQHLTLVGLCNNGLDEPKLVQYPDTTVNAFEAHAQRVRETAGLWSNYCISSRFLSSVSSSPALLTQRAEFLVQFLLCKS